MMLTVVLVCLFAVSTVSATENATSVVGVEIICKELIIQAVNARNAIERRNLFNAGFLVIVSAWGDDAEYLSVRSVCFYVADYSAISAIASVSVLCIIQIAVRQRSKICGRICNVTFFWFWIYSKHNAVQIQSWV